MQCTPKWNKSDSVAKIDPQMDVILNVAIMNISVSVHVASRQQGINVHAKTPTCFACSLYSLFQYNGFSPSLSYSLLPLPLQKGFPCPCKISVSNLYMFIQARKYKYFFAAFDQWCVSKLIIQGRIYICYSSYHFHKPLGGKEKKRERKNLSILSIEVYSVQVKALHLGSKRSSLSCFLLYTLV